MLIAQDFSCSNFIVLFIHSKRFFSATHPTVAIAKRLIAVWSYSQKVISVLPFVFFLYNFSVVANAYVHAST
jgi:hypothetical protein